MVMKTELFHTHDWTYVHALSILFNFVRFLFLRLKHIKTSTLCFLYALYSLLIILFCLWLHAFIMQPFLCFSRLYACIIYTVFCLTQKLLSGALSALELCFPFVLCCLYVY